MVIVSEFASARTSTRGGSEQRRTRRRRASTAIAQKLYGNCVVWPPSALRRRSRMASGEGDEHEVHHTMPPRRAIKVIGPPSRPSRFHSGKASHSRVDSQLDEGSVSSPTFNLCLCAKKCARSIAGWKRSRFRPCVNKARSGARRQDFAVVVANVGDVSNDSPKSSRVVLDAAIRIGMPRIQRCDIGRVREKLVTRRSRRRTERRALNFVRQGEAPVGNVCLR